MKEIYDSPFFTLGDEKLSKEQLVMYCKIWWPIQYPFTLGLVQLLGRINEKMINALRDRKSNDEEILKHLFNSIAPAIVDEMGMGRDPHGLMHHDLFLKQVTMATELSRADVIENPIDTKANRELSASISKAFDSLVRGLCMMYVVETVAPKIFETQKKIFLAAGVQEEKLLHSNLHVVLEKEHAGEAAIVRTFAGIFAGNQGDVDSLVATYTAKWREFLDDVYENVMQLQKV